MKNQVFNLKRKKNFKVKKGNDNLRVYMYNFLDHKRLKQKSSKKIQKIPIKDSILLGGHKGPVSICTWNPIDENILASG